MSRRFLARLGDVVRFRIGFSNTARSANKASLTFGIAHFNAPEFLDATLHSIRRFHPEARVIVADASSEWHEYLAAKAACRRHLAEFHPLAARHRHTGLLNYIFREIRSHLAVFLDQDCVLLSRLDPLIRLMESGKALVGPRDEFLATHANFCARYPHAAGHPFRTRPEFVHASLMVMDVQRIRMWSTKPFIWRNEWGKHPLERYYGLTELIRRNQPDGVLTLDSVHTGYGLGHVYIFNNSAMAYHQWYSGQIYGQTGKMDDLYDADWLRAEMKRFLGDYWDGEADFRLPSTIHIIGEKAKR